MSRKSRSFRITRALVLVMVVAACVWGQAGPAMAAGVNDAENAAETNPGAGLALERALSEQIVFPGEPLHVDLLVRNLGPGAVAYTLVEETPPGFDVVAVDQGAYNANAGIVVWRAALSGGEERRHAYTLTVPPGPPGRVSLSAFLNPADGRPVEAFGTLTRGELSIAAFSAGRPIAIGERGSVEFVVTAPPGRAVTLNLAWQLDAGVAAIEPSASVQLDGSGERVIRLDVEALESGTHDIVLTATPVGGSVDANGRAVVYVGESADRAAPGQAAGANEDAVLEDSRLPPQTSETVRDLEIVIPEEVVVEGGDLYLVASRPPGGAFIDGSLAINGQVARNPISGDGFFVTLVPLSRRVEVRYCLSGDGSAADAFYGILAVGPEADRPPRLIWGDARALDALETLRSATVFERPRRGVVILEPHAGPVARGQVDVVVDAPLGSSVDLSLNGVQIPADRIGAEALDPGLARQSSKYIALRLQEGENRLVATAKQANGTVLHDEIAVYRVGEPSTLTIVPVTALNTGRVYPLVFEIRAEDENGYPPVDGTIVDLRVTGTGVLTEDAYPQQIGWQIVLHGGRGYVRLEPIDEAGTIEIQASTGAVEAREAFTVEAAAPDWIVAGQAHAEALLIAGGARWVESPELRFFARGTTGDGRVMTVAVDSERLLSENPASTVRFFEGAGGRVSRADAHVFVRSEKGLDVREFGSENVTFAGELTQYSRNHTGLHVSTYDETGGTAELFYAAERSGEIEEEISADGTGFYRLGRAPLDPGSAHLETLHRRAIYPHDVLERRVLSENDFRIDYATGEIWLDRALPAVDSEGRDVSLLARYRPLDGGDVKPAYGVQLRKRNDRGLAIDGTLIQGYGEGTPRLYGAGADVDLDAWNLRAEIARTRSATRGEGDAYSLKVGYDGGSHWGADGALRYVEADFHHPGREVKAGQSATFTLHTQVGKAGDASYQAAYGRSSDNVTDQMEQRFRLKWKLTPWQPEVVARVVDDAKAETVTTLAGSIALALGRGAVRVGHSRTLSGNEPHRTTLSGSYDLTERLRVTARAEHRRAVDTGLPAFGLTGGLEYRLGSVTLNGGYRLGDAVAGPRLHYGVDSTWQTGEHSSLGVALQQDAPLAGRPQSTGGAIDWTYAIGEARLSLRLDRSSLGPSQKQALTLNAVQPMNDSLAYYLEGLWTKDDSRERRTLRLGAAYRSESLRAVAVTTYENLPDVHGGRREGIWQALAAYRLSDALDLSVSYALRETDDPGRTQRFGIGGAWAFANDLGFEWDASVFQQRETKTAKLGAKAGIRRRLSDNLWLSLGLFSAEYKGSRYNGVGFGGKVGSGVYIGFDVAFDEESFGGLFRRLLSE